MKWNDKKPVKKPTGNTQIYKGHVITKKVGIFWALGSGFKTLKAAKDCIDQNGITVIE